MKIPRRAAKPAFYAVWLLGVPLAHALLPWAISMLACRHGWAGTRPGPWNLCGLVPAVAGGILLSWVAWTAYHTILRTAGPIEVGTTPTFLITSGPYSVSRNPMYVGEALLWSGWTWFFGSIPVGIGLMLLVAGAAFASRVEERWLEARFGKEYREYAAKVPRWLGKRSDTLKVS